MLSHTPITLLCSHIQRLSTPAFSVASLTQAPLRQPTQIIQLSHQTMYMLRILQGTLMHCFQDFNWATELQTEGKDVTRNISACGIYPTVLILFWY